MIAATTALVLAAASGLFVWLRPPPRPPRTISDHAFVAAANEVCAERMPPLRADPQQNRREERNESATARRVERAADGLDGMVDDLSRLPVRAADRQQVTGWIRAWRDYISDGRKYADAVRTADAEAFSAVAAASRDSLRRVGRFARANRIDDCIPR